jgi:DNA-binding MarR family transcriptional regulator
VSIFRKTQGLMLGTRLKRLGDRFLQDVSKIYKSENISFEPAWFPVFFLLDKTEKMKVSELAEELEVTQSAASQMVTLLRKNNLVEFEKDVNDKRIKVVFLSDKGKTLLEEIRPLWDTMLQVLEEIKNENPYLQNFLNTLDAFENILDEKSLYDRVKVKLEN